MRRQILVCARILATTTSAPIVLLAACGDSNLDAPAETSTEPRAVFLRTGDLIELPIGDVVVVAPQSLPDSATYIAISNASEPRLSRVSLRLLLSDFTDVPASREFSNRNYVHLVYNQVARDAYPASIEDEFAERTAGYTGPIRFNDQISYFEHPANIQRYFVLADPDFRRPDGSKPWLFCGSPRPDRFTNCDGRGGWITDTVQWSYGPLSFTHIGEWPHIDERLAELAPMFIKQ